MACDRFVYFDKGAQFCGRDELAMLLADYFDKMASVTWDQDRFFVHLIGKTSPALRRQKGVHDHYGHVEPEREKRWIEIWIGDDCVNVMTRNQDELTNDLAAGLARLIARFWRGKLEEE